LLEIKDRSGRTKFILFDGDSEPVSIDEVIIRETKKESVIKVEEDENEDQKSTATGN